MPKKSTSRSKQSSSKQEKKIRREVIKLIDSQHLQDTNYEEDNMIYMLGESEIMLIASDLYAIYDVHNRKPH